MEKITIETPGPILYGAISTAKAKCGNPTCKCHRHPKRLHGPYYRWTGIIRGKRTTKTISKKMALECQRRIKNYKIFQKQLQKILYEAIRFLMHP